MSNLDKRMSERMAHNRAMAFVNWHTDLDDDQHRRFLKVIEFANSLNVEGQESLLWTMFKAAYDEGYMQAEEDLE